MNAGERLDTQAWHSAVAGAIEQVGEPGFPGSLLGLIGRVAAVDAAAIVAFRHNDIPVILFDRLRPDERPHFYEAYLSGVYLVSPFYRAALDGTPPGLHTLRGLAPDRFTQGEYYRKYYRHIGTADLAGYLVPLAAGSTLFISFGRRRDRGRFNAGEIRRLRSIEPIVHALAARHWEDLGAEDRPASGTEGLHAQFRASFEGFGGPALTPRERDVVRLLLQGHSAKAAARELEISPETVRVHRKHIYAKLGVSSQGDLFSLFLSTLPKP